MIKKSIPVKGMHCASCKKILDQELSKIEGVKKAEVNLKTNTVSVFLEEEISNKALESAIESAGYEIGEQKLPFISKDKKEYKDLLVALAIFLPFFFILKKIGLFSSVGSFSGDLSTSVFTAIIVGLVAGFSTCMALVGGLVLGVSGNYAKKHPEATAWQKFKPHLYFNLGRVLGFFILGGVIGYLGSFFRMTGFSMGMLTLLVGIVMLFLGLQITGIFPRLKSLSLDIGGKIGGNKKYSLLNSMLLGASTFVFPCGFTQAMQVYAISTGSFFSGGLVMGLFALGTAPGLLGLGGTVSFVTKSLSGKTFKFIGIFVIALSLISISKGMVLTGFNQTLANFVKSDIWYAGEDEDVQILKATYALDTLIVPNNFEVEVGRPVRLEVYSKDDGIGCSGGIIIPGLYDKITFFSKDETTVLEFLPKKKGEYNIVCLSGSPRGKVIVN
jgi:uncharacterized protein